MMETNAEYLAQRAARLVILINLGMPALVVIVAVLLREGRAISSPDGLPESLQPLFYVLGAVSLAELAAAYFMRRMFFSPNRVAPICHDPDLVEQWIMRAAMVISALGAAPVLYGVVIYLLGGELSQLAFFGIITLLGYRLLRPTADLIDETLVAARDARGKQ